MSRAFICGLQGTTISDDERSFLHDSQPWGVIAFKRNIDSAEQVRRLCAEVRDILGRADAPILIDQEGGRVQRIRQPLVRDYPSGAVYGQLYEQSALLGVEAAHLGAMLIALDLFDLGFTINCVPVLDLPAEGLTPAIGDRTLGGSVDSVSTLGRAQIDGVMAGGLLPVMKHMPGHGRARVDSHAELPRVDATLSELTAQDFAPFRLWAAHCPFGMTAHVVYSAIDDTSPATLSAAVIAKVIRERIGFGGALMTDDISMNALSGDFRSRAERAIAAGCDLVLHCNGDLAEAREIAAGAPELADEPLRRTNAALAMRRPPDDVDRPAMEARFDALLAKAPLA